MTKTKKDYKVLRLGFVFISIFGLISIIATHTALEFKGDKDLTIISILKDFFISILPELFSTLLIFIILYIVYDIFGLRIRKEFNEEILSKTEKVSNTVDIMQPNIAFIKTKIDSNISIFDLVKNQKDKVKKLIFTVTKSNIFCKGFYKKVLDEYYKSFKILNDGFHVDDEYLSLSFYTTFWEYLLCLQEKSPNEKLIARVIHSNNIQIWQENDIKYKIYSSQLLQLQKDFLAAGGLIIRIFIGSDIEPSPSYQSVMNNMESIGVRTDYLNDAKYTLKYDFVALFKENFTLQWFSSQNSNDIVGSLVKNSVDSEVLDMWHRIYEGSIKKSTKKNLIPNELMTEKEKKIYLQYK